MSPRLQARPRAEAMILAAIHTWAVAGAPRLHRVLPARGREGDPVLLEGERFAGDGLRVYFGEATTWAVAVSDRTAVAVVPPGAAAGPVTVWRQGLRSNAVSFGGPTDEGPPSLVRVDPGDGATGVFRDAPVVARFSHPLEPSSLSGQTFRVWDGGGPVPGLARLCPARDVVVWQGDRALLSDLTHFVMASGLRDIRGRDVAPHLSRFVTCSLVRRDIPG